MTGVEWLAYVFMIVGVIVTIFVTLLLYGPKDAGPGVALLTAAMWGLFVFAPLWGGGVVR
jgi:hypothetical protein